MDDAGVQNHRNMMFHWIASPQQVATAIDAYGRRVEVAIRAVADYFATLCQNDARQNAPWTDRTGNARTGLFSIVEPAAQDVIEIYLSHGHTIEYGLWLEVAHGQRYAIIMQTLERNLPTLERMLKDLLE
jgi:hypothetical protein